jgi:hypothetical protein
MSHADIDPSVPPSGTGCVECLATEDGWWFHLRRCDSSPSQHAQHHAFEAGHPVVTSFEPAEEWFWDYPRGREVVGQPLAPPRHHPIDQAVPGPEGRVPPDWEYRLNE